MIMEARGNGIQDLIALSSSHSYLAQLGLCWVSANEPSTEQESTEAKQNHILEALSSEFEELLISSNHFFDSQLQYLRNRPPCSMADFIGVEQARLSVIELARTHAAMTWNHFGPIPVIIGDESPRNTILWMLTRYVEAFFSYARNLGLVWSNEHIWTWSNSAKNAWLREDQFAWLKEFGKSLSELGRYLTFYLRSRSQPLPEEPQIEEFIPHSDALRLYKILAEASPKAVSVKFHFPNHPDRVISKLRKCLGGEGSIITITSKGTRLNPHWPLPWVNEKEKSG